MLSLAHAVETGGDTAVTAPALPGVVTRGATEAGRRGDPAERTPLLMAAAVASLTVMPSCGHTLAMAKRKTTIYLDAELRLAAKAVAVASDRSESEVIADALRRYLAAGRAAQAREALDTLMAQWTSRPEPLSDAEAIALAIEEVRAYRAERRRAAPSR